MGKILYIINILQKFSSRTNPLTIKEITDLSNKFYHSQDGGKFINEVTTRRALTNYLLDSNALNNMPSSTDLPGVRDMSIPGLHANYKIHILYENPNSTSSQDKFVDMTSIYGMEEDDVNSNNAKRKKEPKAYYYYEPCISEEEITNLVNMIESHPYYTSDEVIQITKALHSIAPAYFCRNQYQDPTNEEIRSDDSTLQNNLHDLHHCIHENKDVIIEYSYYNEKKELIPHTGYPVQITPYKILWSNGYCYLAAYNPLRKDITHYRVDRITFIKSVSKNAKSVSPHKENPVKQKLKYTKEHPIMMSGDPISISLLCKNNHSIINRLLDSFGKNILIRPANDALLQKVFPDSSKYVAKDWLNVTHINANPTGAALWAKEYCAECVLYAPTYLATQIKSDLQDAEKRYL